MSSSVRQPFGLIKMLILNLLNQLKFYPDDSILSKIQKILSEFQSKCTVNYF